MGAHFTDRREHEVMDADWTVSPVTRGAGIAPGRNWALQWQRESLRGIRRPGGGDSSARGSGTASRWYVALLSP